MKYIIKGKEIYTSKGILENRQLLIENGKIKGIGFFNDRDYEEINLQKYKILPGLIDTHIHGCYGYDVMDGTYTALNEMSKFLATVGVTSFVATTVTAQMDKLEKAVENVAFCMEKGLEGAKLLGSYVEGPYISKEYRGAHPKRFIKGLDRNEIDHLLKRARNTIRIVTVAPEIPGSLEIIKYLTEKGIKVSLGHSNATYEESVKAIDSGASIGVHLYNGMRGLHHRETGLLGAVLNKDEVKAEIICDGIHVSVPAIQIALRCKKIQDIVLISDCMRAGGLSDGEFILGELKAKVENGIARIDNGSLAGSTLKLMNGIENMHKLVGASFEDSLKMATINPAKAIDIDFETGTIEDGKCADITAVDENLNVVFTMVNGKVVYRK